VEGGPSVADDDFDEGLFNDGDSAYDTSGDFSDSDSLNSSIMKFREENGRTYHSFGV
jgi:hypothetical protein